MGCSEEDGLFYYMQIPNELTNELNLKENDIIDISVKLGEKYNVLVVKKILTT